MADMNIQDRYNEISEISGLSEEVIRRVLKACRQSLAKSLKRGDRATLPGICTMLPEIKNKVEIGGTTVTSYIKIKVKPSNAMASELEKISKFEKNISDEDNDSTLKLKFVDSSSSDAESGIRIKQINALL